MGRGQSRRLARRGVDRYEAVIDRVAETAGVAMLLGGLDSGKSTLSRELAAAALAAGRTVAYLDADLGQKVVGPPTAVTLRTLHDPSELEPEKLSVFDAMYFVGATSPQGQLLPLVVGAGRLLARAKTSGAELVVVDSEGRSSTHSSGSSNASSRARWWRCRCRPRSVTRPWRSGPAIARRRSADTSPSRSRDGG